jgi:hypothetical protein
MARIVTERGDGIVLAHARLHAQKCISNLARDKIERPCFYSVTLPDKIALNAREMMNNPTQD